LTHFNDILVAKYRFEISNIGMIQMMWLRYILVFYYLVIAIHAEQILEYDIDIQLLKNGDLGVTETIEYDFTPYRKHGIERNIPKVVWSQGDRFVFTLEEITVKQDGKAAAVNVNPNYDFGKLLHLQIGAADISLEGIHRYVIAYIVKHGIVFDPEDSVRDTFYFNLVGTDWDVPVLKVFGHIHLPSSLSAKDTDLSTFSGRYGTQTNQVQTEWTDAHTLELTHGLLQPKEGLTLKLDFPADILVPGGMFHRQKHEADKRQKVDREQKAKKEKAMYDTAYLVKRGKHIQERYNVYIVNWVFEHFFLYLLAWMGYLYLAYSLMKDSFFFSRVTPVRYYPPAGFSLLQSGLLLDKHADREDLSSAIVELGVLGYVQILEKDGRVQIECTQKDTKGLTEEQIYLLDHILFEKEDIFVLKVRKRQEARSLKERIDKLGGILYAWAVKTGYLKYNTKIQYQFFIANTIVLLAIGYALLSYAVLLTRSAENLATGIYFALLLTILGLLSLAAVPRGLLKYTAFPALLISLGALVSMAYTNTHSLLYSREILILLIMLFLVLMLLIFALNKVGTLSKKGKQLQLHLLGFKAFVNRVEAQRISSLLEEDPYYLEKILPYALLFGVSGHWMEHFEAMNIKPPQWYSVEMSLQVFSSTVMEVGSMQAGTATSSSSGGVVSGGFTGGGMGGGGGGSW